MPSGPRIRTDNVYGTVSDDPLTNVATTLNSAGLANLAAVSSAHAIIVLDPLRTAGAPEAVVVTAHTGAATSATITRAAYGTSARQHDQGTLWVHAPTIEDYIRIVTSSTRPSDPYRGQLIFETDTNKYVGRSTGDAWVDAVPLGAWSDYTPSNVNVTVNNGTQVARFTRFGRTIHFEYSLTFGSSTTFGGTVEVGVPVTAASTGSNATVGAALLLQSGSTHSIGTAFLINTARVRVQSPASTVQVNTTTPFTWGTADQLNIRGTYEAAS